MRKKLLTLLLAVAASIGTMFAWDYERVQIGDLYYNLDATNQTAEVTSQNSSYPYWSTTITTAIIPASVEYNSVTYSVTSIGERAFEGCTGLTSIEIPNSVTSIGKWAFSYCDGLTSVTIPNSVTSINNDAFRNCTGLTSIEIPNSVTSIGDFAFHECSSLTSIEIPNSVTGIADEAFSRCSSLVSIIWNAKNCSRTLASFGPQVESFVFGNEVETIPAYCCYGMVNLTSVTIPNSVTSIGEYAFSNCSGLSSVTIPNSVTSIGDYAFEYCSGLHSIEIPNSVTSIGYAAFYACIDLTSLEIPNSVTGIEGYTFYDCYGLNSVTIPNSVTYIAEYAFYYCTDLTSVTIPNSVTSIGNEAFEGCSRLTSIEIPNSVTSIGNSAFSYCTGLTSISVEEGNAVYDSRDNCNAIIETASNTLVAGCQNSTIPNSVTSIGDDAFSYCTGLTSIEIPNSVKSIGESAFYGCRKLTSVTIPNSVTSIGNWAFEGCTGLTSLTCEATTPPTLGGGVFSGVDKSIPLYVPAQSVDLYKAANQWKDFTNILSISGTEPETFLISFLNYDGSELQSSEVAYGEIPAYTGATPTKPADTQYTYSFSGWSPETQTVTSTATYTAQFTSTLNKYVIKFVNYDGNELQSSVVEYGEIPVYEGETPSKPDDEQYTYTFAGWSPSVVTVTGETTYIATFSATFKANTYTIHVNQDCTSYMEEQQ